MNVTPKRRWYQFSLKAMLVVMTLACVGLGWLAYERNELRKREVAIAAIEKLGGIVEFDADQPFRPNWLRTLLGLKSGGEVVRLDFNDTQVTEGGMDHLKGLTKLGWLDLDKTQVTDAGLVHLQGLTKLEWLYLENTHVTDAGLEHLKGLTELKLLLLDGTQVTDAGLAHLKGLTELGSLHLNGTHVTDQGVSELQKALPNLEIIR
jgi:hypothetical protein